VNAIFLSASIPLAGREYFETSDPITIRDAVRAFVGVALRHDDVLVFGGHPAITPLVLQIARSLGREESVVLYQSRYFDGTVPEDSFQFPRLHWTDADPLGASIRNDPDRKHLGASLAVMRNTMLSKHAYRAAVFIGGMKGIEDEFDLFGRLQHGVPRYCVASTGGAAQALFARGLAPESRWTSELATDRAYTSLFRRVLQS